MTKPQVTLWLLNAMTIAFSVAWLVAFVARQFRPLDGTPALDTAMLAIIGFWFAQTAIKGHYDADGKEDDDELRSDK